MARRRIKDRHNPSLYHVTSRIVGQLPLLTDYWKLRLIERMWWLSEFCGIEVWTYTIMDTHGHFELGTPAEAEVRQLPDEEILRRVRHFKGSESLDYRLLQEEMEWYGRLKRHTRGYWLKQMGDISVYMKYLKQSFSSEYNEAHGRSGTLWAERFGSQLHRVHTEAHMANCLYIELNGTRAHLVIDPKDYAFCGYAAALRGDVRLREKIQQLTGKSHWEEAQAEYRKRLFVRGAFTSKPGGGVIPPEMVREVLRQEGRLDTASAEADLVPEEWMPNPVGATHNPEVTRSGAVGSYEEIEALLKKYPHCLGPRRKGPVKLKGEGWSELWGMKRVRPVRRPPPSSHDSG